MVHHRLPLILISLSLASGLLMPDYASARAIHSPSLPEYSTQESAKSSDFFELQEATQLMDEKNYAEALIHIERAIEINPISLMASYNQGICHLELARSSTEGKVMQQELDAAEHAFLRAQSLNPDMLANYFKLGKIALIQKDFDKAKQYYQSALDIDPENTVLHFNLAGVYDEQRQYDKATVHYKRSIELDKSFIYAYNNLGLIYEATHKLDLAEKLYLKALKQNPKYNYARLNLGNLYAEQGRFREAKRLYRKALVYEPDNAWAHLYLGNVYFQNDNFSRAASAYQASIERNPNYATTYYLHAVSLKRLKRYDEALISSLKYMALAPQGRYNKNVLSLILSLKIRQADAKRN